MRVIAIDPGTTESAAVEWNGKELGFCQILPNEELLAHLERCKPTSGELLAIEMIASYGMSVGKEVFETCVWIGRFVQAWKPNESQLIYRRDVKIHHCHSARATDSNVRQALIDRFGQPGKKKMPGLTFPLKGHMWQAFAIATYVVDQAPMSSQQPKLV